MIFTEVLSFKLFLLAEEPFVARAGGVVAVDNFSLLFLAETGVGGVLEPFAFLAALVGVVGIVLEEAEDEKDVEGLVDLVGEENRCALDEAVVG